MKPANDNGSLLASRMKTYDIPDPPYLPMGKNVLVFRLPSETKSAGGIIIAETAQEPKPMGVIIAAGLQAMEILRDHLIFEGDIVWFGRFAGWEREVQRDPAGKGKSILQMKVEDVLGSVDALERYAQSYDIGVNAEDELVYVKRGAS